MNGNRKRWTMRLPWLLVLEPQRLFYFRINGKLDTEHVSVQLKWSSCLKLAPHRPLGCGAYSGAALNRVNTVVKKTHNRVNSGLVIVFS